MILETLLQHLIQGTAVGATYGLVALGYSMQFSAMRLINFAHGESFALGAFVAMTLSSLGQMPFAIAFVVALVIMGILGVAIERVAIRGLYRMPDLNMFTATIGLSLIIRQIINLVWGADAQPFPDTFGSVGIKMGMVTTTPQQIGTLAACIALTGGLELFSRKSRIGLAMRAVAQDDSTAALMGINVARIRSLVFGLSTALGAAAGVLFASMTFAVFDMGLLMGIKGFVAAVLGGLGSLGGAIIGGMLLGLFEQLSRGYISSLYADATSLVAFILVLLLRPQGLLGKRGSPWGKV
jgi:branched-chain amino acid transport system permease protein